MVSTMCESPAQETRRPEESRQEESNSSTALDESAERNLNGMKLKNSRVSRRLRPCSLFPKVVAKS